MQSFEKFLFVVCAYHCKATCLLGFCVCVFFFFFAEMSLIIVFNLLKALKLYILIVFSFIFYYWFFLKKYVPIHLDFIYPSISLNL